MAAKRAPQPSPSDAASNAVNQARVALDMLARSSGEEHVRSFYFAVLSLHTIMVRDDWNELYRKLPSNTTIDSWARSYLDQTNATAYRPVRAHAGRRSTLGHERSVAWELRAVVEQHAAGVARHVQSIPPPANTKAAKERAAADVEALKADARRALSHILAHHFAWKLPSRAGCSVPRTIPEEDAIAASILAKMPAKGDAEDVVKAAFAALPTKWPRDFVRKLFAKDDTAMTREKTPPSTKRKQGA